MASYTPAPLDIIEPPKHHGQTLNAVSFGFIATAVLFAMFLLMAIFERVLRPHRAFRSRAPPSDEQRPADRGGTPTVSQGQLDSQKPELVNNNYSKSVSVLMPGLEYPTYFAMLIPTPLAPEGVEWPSHAESSGQDPTSQRTASQKEPVRERLCV